MPVVHHPSPAELVAFVDALVAGDHVAADADGTLWAADVGDDTVRCAAVRPDWPPADVDTYLALIDRDYHAGCRAAAEVLRSLDRATVLDTLSAHFAVQLRPRQLLIDALRRAEARGAVIYIVTASPRWSAEAGARLLGVDWPVIGIEPVGAAPGAFVEPVSVEHGKPAAWRARGLPRPALALGDSRWDEPLLEYAHTGLRVTHAGAV